MNSEELKQYRIQLKKKIIDDLKGTLDSLEQRIPRRNQALISDVIQFKRREKLISRKDQRGVYLHPDHEAALNKLSSDTLDFIDNLEESDFKVSIVRKYYIKEILIALLIVGVLIVVLIHFLGGNQRRATSYQNSPIQAELPKMVTISVGDTQLQMGKYEVTNAEFATFLNAHGNDNYIETYELACRIKERNSIFKIEEGYSDHPVVEVTWRGAAEYCKWLSGELGEEYRLPTEQEWIQTANTASKDHIWHLGNSNTQTHSVKTTEDEKGGVNILGNVWEWSQDDFDDLGDGKTLKIVKGGAFDSPKINCVPSMRGKCDANKGVYNIGFRICKRR